MPLRSAVLLTASLCTGVLSVLVYVQDSDLVLLREHLNHPFALAVLACLLMAWAVSTLRWRWVRVLAYTLTGLAACAALMAGTVALAFSSKKETGFVDGPDPYRIRLQESMAGLGPDTVTWLSVRREDGMLSKEWYLGCLNDDDPDDAFDSVTWTGPSAVEIRTADGRTFPMALDPSSGRPRTTLDC